MIFPFGESIESESTWKGHCRTKQAQKSHLSNKVSFFHPFELYVETLFLWMLTTLVYMWNVYQDFEVRSNQCGARAYLEKQGMDLHHAMPLIMAVVCAFAQMQLAQFSYLLNTRMYSGQPLV